MNTAVAVCNTKYTNLSIFKHYSDILNVPTLQQVKNTNYLSNDKHEYLHVFVPTLEQVRNYFLWLCLGK